MLVFAAWIQQIRIADTIDYDGDGFASELIFEVDADAIGSGSVSFAIFGDSNYAPSESFSVEGQYADWKRVTYTARGNEVHGTYDLSVNLVSIDPESGGQHLEDRVDGDDFPVLHDVKLELASNDRDFLPKITSIRQVASLDQDGDSYAQWRDYEVTVSSAIRGSAYLELRRHKFLDFSAPLVSTAPFIIEQNGTVTQTLRVYGSDHDAYNLIAQIKDGAGDVRYELDGSDNPILSGAKMEKAADDPLPPAPSVSLFVIGSPIDVDGDGYARLSKATLQVDIPGWPAVTAYAELVAPTPLGQIPVGLTGPLTVVPGLHLPVTFDVSAPEVLGGGTFDLLLNLYATGGALIKSYDKATFPMLAAVGLETVSRDVINPNITITDVHRTNEVDADGDGYLEYFYFIVSYSSNTNHVAYLSASPEGSHPTQVGQLFTAKTGENPFFLPIQANPDLTHGTYDMTLRIHDEYDKVLDSVLPLEDIDLRDIPMELPSEQTAPVTITDVRRGPSRDEDADGYFEAMEYHVTVESPFDAHLALTLDAVGVDATQTTEYFNIAAGVPTTRIIRVSADPELSHDLYDFKVTAIDVSGVALDESTAMTDPDLNNVPLELLSEVVIPDDPYEINGAGQENETFAQATDLGRLTAPLTLSNLRSFDDDWYKFTTARTGRLDNIIRIDSDPMQGNLALEFLGAEQEWLDGSNEWNDHEQLTLDERPPGTYYIRVHGGWNGNYTLTINAPSDADDGLEVNPDSTHNDSFADAFAFGRVDGPRVENGLNLYDDDWYSFTTVRTGRSDNFVRIDFDRSQGDLALELIGADQAYLDGSNEAFDFEQISLNRLPTGTYHLRVYGVSWETNPLYRLTINAPASIDDAFEQNDAKEAAANLGIVAGRKSWEKLMLFDDDCFSFTTPQTSRPDNFVRIDYNAALGNINLWLTDADGSLINLSEEPTGRNEISLDRLPAGTYSIRVFGKNLETNPEYSLTISAPTGDDDAFEENDEFARAFSLGLLTGSSNLPSAALFDDDYFSFTTARSGGPGDNVRIDYSLAKGNIDLDLLDAEGNLIDFSQEPADSDSVSLQGKPAGTYYVRVYGPNNQTNPQYALAVAAPSLAEDVTLRGTEAADTFVLRQNVAGDTIEVFKSWPVSGLPAVQIARNQIGRIVIDALGGDDRLFIDRSNGDPLPLTGLSFQGGDGADSITISTTTADDWLEVDTAELNISNSRVAYTNTESLRLSDPTRAARLATLVLAPGTRLDLTNNTLVLGNADLASVMALIKSGRNGGLWNGPGLITSSANADQGLAVDQTGDGVEVKFTWNGDVNLDGRINADDYFYIDQGFLQKPNPPVYHNGDFNFDGKIDADDYFMIDQAFLNQKGVVLSAQRARAALTTTTESRPSAKVFSTTRLKKPTRRRPLRC